MAFFNRKKEPTPEQAYLAGREAGFEQGKREGYNTGYYAGHTDGLKEGFTRGQNYERGELENERGLIEEEAVNAARPEIEHDARAAGFQAGECSGIEASVHLYLNKPEEWAKLVARASEKRP